MALVALEYAVTSSAHAPVTQHSMAMSNVAALALSLSAKAKGFIVFVLIRILLKIR